MSLTTVIRISRPTASAGHGPGGFRSASAAFLGLLLLPIVLLLTTHGVLIGRVGAVADVDSHSARRLLADCPIGTYSDNGQDSPSACQQVAAGYYPSKMAIITNPIATSSSGFGITASPDFRYMAAALYSGYIYMSADSGVTWAALMGAGSTQWLGIASTPDFTKLAATVYMGTIHFSVNGGTTWSAWTSAGGKSWMGIACSPDFSMIVATAGDDYPYVSINGGVTWDALTEAGVRYWYGVTVSPDFLKMAACDQFGSASRGGYIYMSSDSGVTWTAKTAAGIRSWQGITSAPDFTKLAATAGNGYIYVSADSGETWNSLAVAVGGNWSGITASPDFSKFAAAPSSGGTIYQSGDGGVTWVTSGGALSGVVAATGGATAVNRCPPGMYSKAGSASCTLCAVGSYATASGSTACSLCEVGKYSTVVGASLNLCRQVAAGYYPSRTATISSPADNWYGVTASPDFRYMSAVVNRGSIFLSSDSGVTWTVLTGAGNRGWYGITSTPDFTKLAATVNNGNIYFSLDGGTTWTAWTSAGVKYWWGIACSPDFSMIAASTSNIDYIYVSRDGGVMWSALKGAGSRGRGGVVASPDFVKMAACDHSGYSAGGYIYMSNDSGVKWTAKTAAGMREWQGITSTPDFTKLAATADNGYIYVSSDSGETWNSLPQEFRFWLGITVSPDFSKFAAVTATVYSAGSIYQSGDGGVTWVTSGGALSGVVVATGGATAVNMCPPGMYSKAGSASCTLCAPGKYSTASGSTVCFFCAAGKYSAALGASYPCTVCGPRMQQSSTGASACYMDPTGQPTMQPSSHPTMHPSGQPTSMPTQPTGQPTNQPTQQPTGQPTMQPTSQPSMQPSGLPTGQPTTQPSTRPTAQPTMQPSGQPTTQPTSMPTQPTGQPTGNPTHLAGSKDFTHYVGLVDQGGVYNDTATFTNLGTRYPVYLSLSLYRAGWGGDTAKFVTFSAWNQKHNNWTEVSQCIPDAPKNYICVPNENQFSSCAFNIDATQYIVSERGGSLKIRTAASPALTLTAPTCMWAGKYPVYAQMVVSTAHGQPTPSPTNPPSIDVNTASNAKLFELSFSTAYQIGVGLALMSAAVGVYFAVLRGRSKAVVLSKPKAGIFMGLIGGEVATSIILIVSIFDTHKDGWAIIITLMRLIHMVVALVIMFTIYGPEGVRARTNFSKLLDSDHMASNAKVYGLASVLTFFDIKAFVLLPWRDSEFARYSNGLPNMAFFKTVQSTTVFTGVVNIATQVPYLQSRPFEAVNYFFYANIAIQMLKIAVSLFEYCILTTKLRSCATADMSPSEQGTDSSKDAKATSIEEGSALELIDMVPNPLQRSGITQTNSLAATSNDAAATSQSKYGDAVERMQKQQKEAEHQKELSERQKEAERQQREMVDRQKETIEQQRKEIERQREVVERQQQEAERQKEVVERQQRETEQLRRDHDQQAQLVLSLQASIQLLLSAQQQKANDK